MTGNAQMSAHGIDEGGIAPGGPDGRHVADEPEDKTRNPEPKFEPQGCRKRAVDDRDRPRRAARQDWLSERAMDGHDKACDQFLHQITTPPPKEKNDRKKLEAANAIDRPNTIWISLRKPPDESPKRERQPSHDDDDDGDDLGDRTFNRLQDLIEGLFPRHEPAAHAGADAKRTMPDMTSEAASRRNQNCGRMSVSC
ncbi:hypothetical protein ACVW0W_003201 [Bradyrhizobium sp. USDA 4469]